jgi:hypothetical protein
VIGRLLLAATLLLAAGSASAQQAVAHMEACADWDFVDGTFGTRNGCPKPIAILFMTLADQRIVERNVLPGGRFDAGVGERDLRRGWLFTACPVGYLPNVKFSVANGRTILDSLYNCLPAGRPGV